MNTTGCPAGYFTDHAFGVPRSGQSTCSNSISAYWAATGFLMLVRVLLSIVHIQLAVYFVKRRQEDASGGNASSKKRRISIPYTTVLETSHTIANVVGWPLIGANVANYRNGLGPSLILIIILPFTMAMVLSSLKLVHLGNRIIPRDVRNRLSISPGRSNEEELKLKSARDPLLRVLFFAMVGGVIGVFFPIFTTVLVSPGMNDISLQIGMGAGTIVGFTTGAVVVRQTYRVVQYIEVVHRKHMEVVSGAKGVSEKKLNRTLRLMKLRSILFAISVCGSCSITLITACGVYPSWYALVLLIYTPTIGGVGTTLMYIPPKMKIFCFQRRERKEQGASDKIQLDLKAVNQPAITALTSPQRGSEVVPENTNAT